MINITSATRRATLRVLMQNRPNVLTQPGGDTVVMKRTIEGLARHGVEVVLDENGTCNPRDFDVVHLFNFALPDLLRSQAERAHRAGVPFVVTTLCEDVPAFHHQSREAARILTEYVQRGQERSMLEQQLPRVRTVQPSGRFNNDWTAAHAEALITNGERETRVVKRDYPGARRVLDIPLGFEIGAAQSSRESFIREFGVENFILCVGRIESRKNQLMLLAALEDSPLCVVFAGGGVSYQPDYENAVRNFRRKGKTLMVPRLSPDMLASAYCAARVHVLPSWYELPGLVSLEAAAYGCALVATDCGTTRDYLANYAYYADPASPDSIFNAVMAAYHAPLNPDLKAHVQQFSWSQTAERTLRLYQEVARPRVHSVVVPQVQMHSGVNAGGTPSLDELIACGERAAIDGNYARAHELLAEAMQANPGSARLMRARAAVYLAEQRESEARALFEKVISIDANDAKAWAGLGMCHVLRNDSEGAYPLFVKALHLDPLMLTAMHQLVQCSYRLNHFADLDRVLRVYLREKPGDIEIEFCLAGCLVKQNQVEEAQRMLQGILAKNPAHQGARELVDYLRSVAPAAPATAGMASSPATPSAFTETDSAFAELEDAKRNLRFKELEAGILKLRATPSLTAAQHEHLDLIEAESAAMQGDLKTGDFKFDTIIARNPRCARALAGKGALAAHRAQISEAEGLFRRALEVQPNYDVAFAGLGVCASLQGKREVAWQYFKTACETNPENLRAVLGMIEVGYGLGRLSEVEVALRAYLDHHPADLNILYSLAGCCFAQKKLDEATSAVEQIMLFEPQNEKAVELRHMIEKTRSGGSWTPGASA